MPSSADGPESSVGSGSCLNQELLPLNFESPTFIVPLDASRTSGLLIDNLRVTQLRAAASTQTLGCFFLNEITRCTTNRSHLLRGNGGCANTSSSLSQTSSQRHSMG